MKFRNMRRHSAAGMDSSAVESTSWKRMHDDDKQEKKEENLSGLSSCYSLSHVGYFFYFIR